MPLPSVPNLICVEDPRIDIQYPVKAQDADSSGDQYDKQRDHVREDSEIAGFFINYAGSTIYIHLNRLMPSSMLSVFLPCAAVTRAESIMSTT